jgi:predicted acetyltransferase
MLESGTMPIEIRTIGPDELEAFIDTVSIAFLDRPDVARIAEALRPRWDLTRVWAALDGGRMVGTFRSWATELTVPGGTQLPAAAIAAVTVLPSHRRQGIMRGIAAAEHAAIRERGEAVGLLYASEYPIYGRLGYGPASRVATWTLDVAATGFHGPDPGGVELVAADRRARDEVVEVFDRWRLGQTGEIRRRDDRWDEELGLREATWGSTWKGFLALHRDATGRADGYARYRADLRWEDRQPRGELKVDDLHALTDAAYAGLWRFLAESDLVSRVEAEGRSPGERLPWLLTNARAAVPSQVGEGMWVRLLDVRRALAARAYEASGTCVLEVVDPETGPGRTLRLELDVAPGGAECRTSDREPDLTLPVAALGAAYLGGVRLRDAVIATGVDEHRPGAVAALDALLRTADEPWCSTFF